MFKIFDGREQFYQWDIDRRLVVADPEVSEVHFCNRTDNCSLVCETYVEDGITFADVPNILLQTAWRIRAYAYDGKHTKHEQCYEVVPRTKPADYVYTETEIFHWNDLVERIDEIEKNGVSSEVIEEAVERYLDENDISVDLTGYATEKYVDDAIAAVELLEGPAGKDGYTPVKGVDYFDGRDGKDGKDGKDYILTDTDKREIAGMVEVSGGGEADLSNYYTKSEVDDAIDAIELTAGPVGPKGEDGYTPIKGVDYFDGKDGKDGTNGIDGKDYVLTDADKQEIADLVDVSGADVDLSGYYTKTEIDDLLANLPTGDIPSGEEVKF